MERYDQNWNEEFKKNTAFLERGLMMNIVEIGCYQGLTSNYICDTLLAWNGRLICIDDLDDNYSLDNDNDIFKGQFDRFTENIERNKNRITLIREKSQVALPLIRSDSQEFVYIDGHHAYPECYLDGTEAFRIVKPGGFILWDDYLWGNTFPVKEAVDQVLRENPNHELLLKYNQVLVKKTEVGSITVDGQDWYQEESVKKLFNDDTIYAAYTNLDIRADRNEKMIAEIKRIGFQTGD